MIPAELTVIDDLLEFEAYNIQQESDLERIAIVGQLASKRIKELDTLRLSMTAPIKAGIKVIEDEFHRITDPLQNLKKSLSKKVGDYWDKVHVQKEEEAKLARAKALEEERALLDLAATAALSSGSDLDTMELETRTRVVEKLETAPVVVKQTVRMPQATMAQTRVWKCRVVDPKLVPREYLIVNEGLLNTMARSKDFDKAMANIPGVEFYQESKASFAR